MKPYEKAWYAMRVTYSREMKLKIYLDSIDIVNFLPMKYTIKIKKSKKVKELIPIIHNLIFIYSTREKINDLKQFVTGFADMRYIMSPCNKKEPITVRQCDMENFITVSGTYDERLIYLSTDDLKLKRGERVRILGGSFAGVEGEIMSIRGSKRVVVSIPGFLAVATVKIPMNLIAKI